LFRRVFVSAVVCSPELRVVSVISIIVLLGPNMRLAF
jgi:hypothetical protein